jgi:hypothetical protein
MALACVFLRSPISPTEIIGALGLEPTGWVQADVKGPWVALAAANHPDSLVRVASWRDWTVIALEPNAVLDAASVWKTLARERSVRCLALVEDELEDVRAFALWGPSGLERACTWCDGDWTEGGTPLAIEAGFAHPGQLEFDDLLLVATSLGIDVDDAHGAGVFELIAVTPKVEW